MRTKNQIKVDRLFSVLIGMSGLIGIGFFTAEEDILKMFISFLATLVLIRVDKCNNDLEYGRYVRKPSEK